MKKIFVLVFASISTFYFSQQKITVSDAENQKPIPYAKLILKGKDYYRNTEENGEITLEKDEEVSEIQSFGYENLLVQENKAKYFLKPKVIEIDEVTLVKPKFAHSFKIGSLKTYGSFGGGFKKLSSFWGKIITSKISVDKLLFIKNIRFKTTSDKENVVIKIVIFENSNGLPGEVLRSEEIVCKIGKNKTQEFEPKLLVFPKEGVIVGFEWVLNETNKYESTMIVDDLGTKEKIELYLPHLSGSKEEDGNLIWGSLKDGSWKFRKIEQTERFKHKFNPAIEVELTD